jgi:hypothetical protein
VFFGEWSVLGSRAETLEASSASLAFAQWRCWQGGLDAPQ